MCVGALELLQNKKRKSFGKTSGWPEKRFTGFLVVCGGKLSTRGFADIFSCSVIVFPLPFLPYVGNTATFINWLESDRGNFRAPARKSIFPSASVLFFYFNLCPKGREDGKANTFIQQPATKKSRKNSRDSPAKECSGHSCLRILPSFVVESK